MWALLLGIHLGAGLPAHRTAVRSALADAAMEFSKGIIPVYNSRNTLEFGSRQTQPPPLGHSGGSPAVGDACTSWRNVTAASAREFAGQLRFLFCKRAPCLLSTLTS